ncbi:mitochondrial chaperone BCS1 protein [Dioscorea alata]|uniref:Mitochondrial chaperone BCS1 protein n=3 Tax=Dioscorea alata TaxID=55571 RepID=A0ACB7WIW7_DIOAL|nr:mitochondrial chaperone BCS1 protein [Dioscorea alata]KAH7688154.1 mitochondrial chaperone BCS1 protein [Dioscorea alata]KAH7688155.1 mitochondrial chaperone BCS1 protein [Dioscorea alata]
MKEVWTSIASLLGALAFFQSILQAVFPPQLRFTIAKLSHRLFQCFSTYCYFEITETDGVNTNELYNAVQLYLSRSASVSASRLSLSRALNSSSFTFSLSNNDQLVDTFNGATATWEHVVTQRQNPSFSWRAIPDEKRGFTLSIKKKDKPIILQCYLNHIMLTAAQLRHLNQDRLLFTNSRGGALDSRGHPWESVPFKHPSTFDTLALDPARKLEILLDLRDFADGQAFYKKTGRAWKRGYLLYGPPGTGKSSLIAAMANFLGYDIYDLELTEVHSNSELRKLLMKTTPKSIIVIEDIDCSINLSNRSSAGKVTVPCSGPDSVVHGVDDVNSSSSSSSSSKTITLSGLLNFTDGLWSCCGSERIFVFTTNHIEKLDPALLRSGRMDMHIFMSYCSFPALKILMKNYLDWDFDGEENGDEDELLKELEEVVDGAEMTPADISEVLIKNRRFEKRQAAKELLQVLRNRVLAKRKKSNGNEVMMEEEQEKRALESPKEDEETMVNHNEKKNNAGKDK